jgi:adenosylhomocysteinase
MDVSCANQVMAQWTLIEGHEAGERLPKEVIGLPEDLDQRIAGVKLTTMGIAVDHLTDEQVAYATDYSAGT